MTVLSAIWKFLRGLWHVLVGMWTIYVRFPQLTPEQREMRVQAWALQFLALWGIHLRVIGQPVASGPALMVANHISWLDIMAVHAVCPQARFVSKAEVHHACLCCRTLAFGSCNSDIPGKSSGCSCTATSCRMSCS